MMSRFEHNVQRCCNIVQYDDGNIKSVRPKFGQLSESEFFLVWSAAMLRLFYFNGEKE